MAKIPFALEAWLKDKSQKVETGDGVSVSILCTNAEGTLPIIGNVGEKSENLRRWTEKGQYHIGLNTPNEDLFIVTPEEELTEFEKAIKEMMRSYVKMPDEVIKETAARLLDLARKELKKTFVLLHKDDYQTAFDLGQAEALKDLPRWKKICRGNNYSSETKFTLNGRYLEMNDTLNDVYEVSLYDLKKLPKEDEE